MISILAPNSCKMGVLASHFAFWTTILRHEKIWRQQKFGGRGQLPSPAFGHDDTGCVEFRENFRATAEQIAINFKGCFILPHPVTSATTTYLNTRYRYTSFWHDFFKHWPIYTVCYSSLAR